MIGLSEKSGIEIESEYQLTGHPVYVHYVGKAKLSNPSTVTTQINLVLLWLFGQLGWLIN